MTIREKLRLEHELFIKSYIISLLKKYKMDETPENIDTFVSIFNKYSDLCFQNCNHKNHFPCEFIKKNIEEFKYQKVLNSNKLLRHIDAAHYL